MRKRNINIAIRVTEKEYEAICKKASRAKLDLTNYLIAAGMNKDIKIVEGITEMLPELKRIGNNLNQITVLAHTKKISAVNLEDATMEFRNIHAELQRLAHESEVK